jgi:hypothetical protein
MVCVSTGIDILLIAIHCRGYFRPLPWCGADFFSGVMPEYKSDPRDSTLEPALLPRMALVISSLTAVIIGRSGNLSIHRKEPIHVVLLRGRR